MNTMAQSPISASGHVTEIITYEYEGQRFAAIASQCKQLEEAACALCRQRTGTEEPHQCSTIPAGLFYLTSNKQSQEISSIPI